VHLSHDDLIAQDLAPYIELFQREDDRVRAVMVSHGGFPNIDIRQGVAGGRVEPASLNRSIVTNLLREELGYTHLVVTDDLEMGAISKHAPIERAVRRAFEAGQDMLLICSRPDLIRKGYDVLLQAARDGEITPQRIEASLKNIAEFKVLVQPPLPFDKERFRALSDEVAVLNNKLNYTYGGAI
jgi:beta-N-acetylhexosaminidase